MRTQSFMLAALAASALAVAACTTGPSVERYRPASSAAGAHIQLTMRDGRIGGELLEVRDSGLVVLTEKEIVLVGFTGIRGFKTDAERLPYRGGALPNPVRERLRLISRFPAGVPPAAMTRLLEARGMQAVRILPP